MKRLFKGQPLPPEMRTARLEECVRRVTACSSPLALIVFGSYARGDATEESDVDLACVFSSDAEAKAMRGPVASALQGMEVPVDILLFGSDPFLATIPSGAKS